MAFEDIVSDGSRCYYRPLLADKGETLLCESDHPIADIVAEIRKHVTPTAASFANWRGTTPPADRPLDWEDFRCPVCRKGCWVVISEGDYRPWTENGFRCLPGDPGYDDL